MQNLWGTQTDQLAKVNGKIKFLAQRHLKKQCWERDNFTCRYCGVEMLQLYYRWKRGELKRVKEALLTVDHVIPLSKGGTWDLDNMVTCCSICNQIKGSNLPEKLQKKLDFIESWYKRK